MNSRKWILIAATISIAALTTPIALSAQHARYKLIDLGTLGGPSSSTSEIQTLNNRGMLVGGADTLTPNPSVSNPCLFCGPDPFLAHAFQWQQGRLTDLGALPGANTSFANWVSDSGLSVGWSSDNDQADLRLGIPQTHATVWKNGEIVDLGTLEGGYESVALAANNRGQVVGVSANLVADQFGPLGTQNRIFLWQNGAMEDLNTLGGPDAGFLDLVGNVAINERGQVAACSFANSTPNPVTGTPTLDPFLWQHGTMSDLGSLGGTSGCATALNTRGEIIGYSNLAGDLTFHAFLWDRGLLNDLGTFGGNNAIALAINDRGHIVGRADTTTICTSCPAGNQGQLHHPFFWKNGTMIDLGLIPGDDVGTAFSINSKDQILISSTRCIHIRPDDSCDGVRYHALLWENGAVFDLQTLVDGGSDIPVNQVTNINERGEIAGTGVLPNGDMHAFVLIPCTDSDDGCGSAAARTMFPAKVSQASVAQTPTAINGHNPRLQRGENPSVRRFPWLRK
jgi:probable HAF family extracellular repeat protein